MLLRVEHKFEFGYDGFISESFLELRVQPKPTATQTVASFSLAVGPPTRVFRYRDWNDNLAHHFTVTKFHDRIEVASRSLVETKPSATPPDAVTEPPARETPWMLHDYLELGGPVRASVALRDAHRAVKVARTASLGEQVAALGAYLHEEFDYQQNVTRYDSTTDDFLKFRRGVCQDFAHLMLGFLRLRGIPCRYVSGYLHVERTKTPSQSHAWIEFWAPLAGWIPFDPTHNKTPDEHYVVVGHGRSYDDVPPNRGIYRGSAREAMTAEVLTEKVTRRGAGASFQEEIVAIDLPVYAEVPKYRPEGPRTAEDAAAEEQQQQQQQQQ